MTKLFTLSEPAEIPVFAFATYRLVRTTNSNQRRYTSDVNADVPKLGYMYPWGYICLSEGVHLRLAIEGKICLYCILIISNYLYMYH